jgi:hypothetical protein
VDREIASTGTFLGNLLRMTTPGDHTDPSTQPENAGMSLLPEQAKATVEEIKADNAALEEQSQVVEAQAEAVVEQARQLAEVTEEVLEELREGKGSAW